MTEPEWYRQPRLSCEFCGKPGHLIPIPERPMLLVADIAAITEMPRLETRVTCPEHRFLVKNRALRQTDEDYFAEHDHGRPILNEPTHPERMRSAIRDLFRRLGYDVDTP